MFVIPLRTEVNEVIVFFKINDDNYQNFILVNFMKVTSMLVDTALEINPPNGVIAIFDPRGVSIPKIEYSFKIH